MLLNLMITEINIAYDILFFRQSWRVLSASYESSTKTKQLFALLTVSPYSFSRKNTMYLHKVHLSSCFHLRRKKSDKRSTNGAFSLPSAMDFFSRLQKGNKINTHEKRSWMNGRFSFRRKVIGWGWGLQRISKAAATMRVWFFDERRTLGKKL